MQRLDRALAYAGGGGVEAAVRHERQHPNQLGEEEGGVGRQKGHEWHEQVSDDAGTSLARH